MNSTRLLERLSVLCTLGFLATIAYFHARGTSALVLSSLSSGESSRARAAPLIARTQQPQQPRTAAAILARNPFDSLTGPLESLPPFSEPDGPINRDPLVAPECDSPLAVIVTESSAPACSLAALQTSADARPQNRRVGDTIAGKTVEFIGYNPQRGVPSVWLSSKKGLCQSPLFSSARYDDRDHRGGSAAQAGAPPGSEPSIDPAEIETVLRSRVRVVPEQKNGQIIGIRLFGIGSDSLLAMLGLKNGDRLESINGFLLGSPDQALTAYARLRSANHLDVKLNRGGRPMMLGYRMN